MTEDEYINLHTRLKNRYRDRYPNTNRHTLKTTYHNDPAAHTATNPTDIYNDICNTLDQDRQLHCHMILVHDHIRQHASPYRHHQTAGRGLARITELDHEPIATPDTIRQIRESIDAS